MPFMSASASDVQPNSTTTLQLTPSCEFQAVRAEFTGADGMRVMEIRRGTQTVLANVEAAMNGIELDAAAAIIKAVQLYAGIPLSVVLSNRGAAARSPSLVIEGDDTSRRPWTNAGRGPL